MKKAWMVLHFLAVPLWVYSGYEAAVLLIPHSQRVAGTVMCACVIAALEALTRVMDGLIEIGKDRLQELNSR